jgi:hypothetical protein
MAVRDEIIQEIHKDLKEKITALIEKRGIILEEPCEVGFSLIFEGVDVENTTARVIKPLGVSFSLKVDIEGNETQKDLDELALFFIEYLQKSMEADMVEILTFCHILQRKYPTTPKDDIYNMAVTAFQGMKLQDEYSEQTNDDKKIIAPSTKKTRFSKLYGINKHRNP